VTDALQVAHASLDEKRAALRMAGFEFVAADEAARPVTPLVGRRIAACLKAHEMGTVATLESGRPAALGRLLLSRRQPANGRAG
jgi:hypothetical protein